MKDWMPSEPMIFGLDRSPHIDLPNGFVMVPDRNVSDTERRTWKERLLERPWRPWVRTKFKSVAYIVEKQVIVSWTTFNKLKLDSSADSKKESK